MTDTYRRLRNTASSKAKPEVNAERRQTVCAALSFLCRRFWVSIIPDKPQAQRADGMDYFALGGGSRSTIAGGY